MWRNSRNADYLHPYIVGILNIKSPRNLTKLHFSARIQICDAIWLNILNVRKTSWNGISFKNTVGIYNTWCLQNVPNIVQESLTLVIYYRYFGRKKLTISTFMTWIQICDVVWSYVSNVCENIENDTSLQNTDDIWQHMLTTKVSVLRRWYTVRDHMLSAFWVENPRC